jgi:sugar lactone lactonase YvrE
MKTNRNNCHPVFPGIVFALLAAFCIGATAQIPERKPFITGLNIPVGMTYDAQGALYIAEWGASRVCKYDRQGNRTIVTEAVGRPSGLTISETGTLFIASYDRGIVYALTPDGELRPVASGFSTPAGLLWRDNAVLVANRDAGEIVKLGSDGSKEVISHGHSSPVGIVGFSEGSFIVSCLNGGIDHIKPDSTVSTINKTLRAPAPGMIAADNSTVLVADYGGTAIFRVTLDGAASVVADGFQTPVGLARRPDGRLLVADWGPGAVFTVEVE